MRERGTRCPRRAHTRAHSTELSPGDGRRCQAWSALGPGRLVRLRRAPPFALPLPRSYACRRPLESCAHPLDYSTTPSPPQTSLGEGAGTPGLQGADGHWPGPQGPAACDACRAEASVEGPAQIMPQPGQ